jgi:outer membrane scaffolding protein for murein synthesis (MipA/OmpV family)
MPTRAANANALNASRGIGSCGARPERMTATFARRFASLAIVLSACAPSIALSQTPSPLQEWQYSSGIVLERLFQPTVPQWRVVLGAAAEYKPLYDGAQLTRVQGGPVINVRYRDIAFASLGEGIGVNVLHGKNYLAGIALGYDLGRRVSDDYGHLHGLGDIGRAPAVKAFVSYAVSKNFPLVVRADVRQIVGGADGLVADFGAYMPLPGSSKKLIMFAGPSITYANRRYVQKEFGVTAAQALASGYPVYDAHAGSNTVGFGFSATRFVTDHWLVNMDATVNRLLGSARDSPITQRTVQPAVALSVAYQW